MENSRKERVKEERVLGLEGGSSKGAASSGKELLYHYVICGAGGSKDTCVADQCATSNHGI